jgi:hypothetical protein
MQDSAREVRDLVLWGYIFRCIVVYCVSSKGKKNKKEESPLPPDPHETAKAFYGVIGDENVQRNPKPNIGI